MNRLPNWVVWCLGTQHLKLNNIFLTVNTIPFDFKQAPSLHFSILFGGIAENQEKTLHVTPIPRHPTLPAGSVNGVFSGGFEGVLLSLLSVGGPGYLGHGFDWTTPHSNTPKLRLLMVKPHLPVEAKHDMNQTGRQQDLESSGILFVGKHFWWKDCNINLGYPKMVDQLETWNTLQRK